MDRKVEVLQLHLWTMQRTREDTSLGAAEGDEVKCGKPVACEPGEGCVCVCVCVCEEGGGDAIDLQSSR